MINKLLTSDDEPKRAIQTIHISQLPHSFEKDHPTTQTGPPPYRKLSAARGVFQMTSLVTIVRRKNEDSTFDSICKRCYQTIAREQDEADLLSAEQAHTCDPNGEFSQRRIDS